MASQADAWELRTSRPTADLHALTGWALRHLLLASFAAYQASGPGDFPWWHVGVGAAWGAAGLAAALRYFRWDIRPN